MTRRQQTLRLALLCLLALLAAGWLFFEPAERAGSAPSPLPDAAPGTETAAVPRPATVRPSLPPQSGAPSADIASSLAALADAGDGQAACRLSAELMRCRFLTQAQADANPGMTRNIARLQAAGKHDQARMLEARLSKMNSQLASCASLPAGLDKRALHYFRVAAMAGNPGLLYRYASGSGFESERGYGYLATPEFDQWRGEAEAAMQRALSQGRPEAALALRMAYASDDGLFPGLVANDDRQAYAYARLIERLFGDTLAAAAFLPPRPSIPPAEAQLADTLAADWHQRYFDQQQFDVMSVMARIVWQPWQDDAPDDACRAGSVAHD